MSNINDYMDICESLSKQFHQAKQASLEASALYELAIAQQKRYIAVLEKRIDDLKPDAERYRFVRLHRHDDWKWMPAEIFDECVDSAIAKQLQEQAK